MAAASLVAPLLLVFGPILFRDRQFAFQDAGHYYYPLLQRVQQEWDAGRWPLWSPEASAGTPLLGNPTAAVLYPGKVVFALLPFPWAMRVYLVGHVALAFAAQWAMLRAWHVSAAGATLGALAYAFGVPVLSQTSNMIFLVGAAWAPLGLLAADRWARDGRLAALPALAAVLALQVLGGDPEAAYVTVACASGYAACLAASRSARGPGWWARRAAIALVPAYLGLLALSWWAARAARATATTPVGSPSPWTPPIAAIVAAAWGVVAAFVLGKARGGDDDARRIAARVAGPVAAAALALAIAGAQLLPIVESTRMSFRAAESAGLHDMYPYSARPLQLLDAAWPGVFGRLEGGYRSWLNALPPKPDSRLWMPSLYLGTLTLALASAGFGARGGPPWRTWLSAVAVLALLAGIGYYGSPLLWARCVPGLRGALGPIEPPFNWQVRTDGLLRDGDGGVYWLLATALPGFRGFRYPPKLFIFAALAIAGLAGAGWDRVAAGASRRARMVAAILLAASLMALAASWLGASALRGWFDGLAQSLKASDEPLDVPRALADLRRGLGHGAIASALALGLIILAPRRRGVAGAFAVAFLAADLVLANADHVVSVPQSAFEGTPRALELIRGAERANPSPGPYRVQRVGRWWPEHLSDRGGAPRDFARITRWERDTLRANYQMPLGVESTFYFDTIEPIDYGLFFLPWALDPGPETARARGLKAGQKVWYHPRRGLDLWNTRYFIVPGYLLWDSAARGFASAVPRSTYVYPPRGAFDGPGGAGRRARWLRDEDFQVFRNEAAYPRAWVVHRAYLIPPASGLAVGARGKVMQELLYQSDDFWRVPGVPVRDPRAVAWVETDRPGEVDRLLSRAAPDPAEAVAVTRDEPTRVELTARLRSPGLVVVAERFAPGWALTVDGRPAAILRANRAMRGVALPKGEHRLIFTYEPLSFRLGLALSAAGLAGLAASIVAAIRRRGG